MSEDRQALRDFQAEQERRDRELLDQDLSEAQLRPREQAWDRDSYELPREDGDWSPSDELPPDDENMMDEPPFDEPPYDDGPALDEGYDPPGGGYRP